MQGLSVDTGSEEAEEFSVHFKIQPERRMNKTFCSSCGASTELSLVVEMAVTSLGSKSFRTPVSHFCFLTVRLHHVSQPLILLKEFWYF